MIRKSIPYGLDFILWEKIQTEFKIYREENYLSEESCRERNEDRLERDRTKRWPGGDFSGKIVLG